MKTFIALFRGINVSGNNISAMKDLVALLEKLGSHSVKTYIQSGNAVFLPGRQRLPAIKQDQRCDQESHGFEPQTVLLDSAELEKAMASESISEAESEPTTLHLFFLAAVLCNPDLKA
jgi:uncharacterized protein (DUF1697 family)